MLAFENDYSHGMHEKILERLTMTNKEATVGYGCDEYCVSAKEKIKKVCNCPDAEVFLLVGGTQTNQIVIDGMLKNYEGVVAAETGHVSVHEAGAIEYTGHKVLTLPQHEGKIEAAELKKLLLSFWQDESHEHMVFPGMVYISHPTEYGTLYSEAELTQLHEVCKEYEIPLYLDGARLAYGLMSSQTDVSLEDIARLCDVFYIGGTKAGAMFGEAVVFTKKNAPKHFFTTIKQHGALLAKGRMLGIQFDTLFTDELFFEIGKHGITCAEKLKEIFRRKNYRFYMDSPTNQQFIIMENTKMEALKDKVSFSIWAPFDDFHTITRFVTSFATTKEDLQALEELL